MKIKYTDPYPISFSLYKSIAKGNKCKMHKCKDHLGIPSLNFDFGSTHVYA